MAKKSPSLFGFKPTDEDRKMMNELMEQLQKNNIATVTNADVLRHALKLLHQSVFVPERSVPDNDIH